MFVSAYSCIDPEKIPVRLGLQTVASVRFREQHKTGAEAE